MQLILNGINGHYLRGLTELAIEHTERVDAAVAYATDAALLFDWCWEHNRVLRYWGRFDDTVPVTIPILRKFLERKSANFTCKLLPHFHAKVIWWRGFGAYIGSANLTGAAWYSNVEAGMFLSEEEMAIAGHDQELDHFFQEMDRCSSLLTTELFKAIERRSAVVQKLLSQDRKEADAFLKIPQMTPWAGLSHVSSVSTESKRKAMFLKEWNSTLQILRNLSDRVGAYRPSWVTSTTSQGLHADIFLHAHYYQRTFEAGLANYEALFSRNRNNPDSAEKDSLEWWKSLAAAPGAELTMIKEWAPFLRAALAPERVSILSEDDFIAVCSRIYAIRDHAQRIANVTVGLVPSQRYTLAEKIQALGSHLFHTHSSAGRTILQTINFVLYDGALDELPERLWEGVSNAKWKIEHFGVSALGELVGWALPDKFPPRNGRTSKALRSLGYDVSIQVG